MSATLLLDSRHTHYTNLDFLSGKVVLHLPTETTIGGIQVKLEGESRTRLSGPRHPNNVNSDKKRTELEVHKILYKVATVFPTPAVMQSGSSATSYTFAAGSYEYPFQFKLPFNNACSTHNSMLTNLNFTGLRVEMARDTNRHVKKTLPPSFGGFPGMADIKYFVKVTVIRPQFYKGNIRAITPLNFLPIEPPRTGNPNEETYARRQHQFSNVQSSQKKKKGIFSRGTNLVHDVDAEPPRVSVDVRLPNPSILTCNEPVPLRLIAKKLTETPDTIFLQILQIELISYTKIRAHDLTRTEIGSCVIMSRSNMGLPLGRPGDPVGTHWTIDSKLWSNLPLPNSVAPSFETCNIERAYELEVRVGLTHGSPGNMKSQLIVLPLRMPVTVYSGIAPPQALLEAMAAAALQPSPSKPKPRPAGTEGNGDDRPPIPPRPANSGPVPADSNAAYDDAPPSYEDAMAENLSPVVGPRREYHPLGASVTGSGADAKSSVQTGKVREDGSAAEGSAAARSRGRRSSSESFDMLPTTPPESDSASPPASPVQRAQSTMKVHRGRLDEESPPQYQPVAETQLQASSTVERRPSQTNLRPMNLGVPNRKPVPGNSNRQN